MIRSPRSAPAAANSRTTRHLPTPRRTAYPPCSAADPRGSPVVTSSCRPSCPGRRLGPTRAGGTIRPRRRASRAVSNSESSPAATATTRWRGPRPFCCLRGVYAGIRRRTSPSPRSRRRASCARPGGGRRGPTNPPRASVRDPVGPCRGLCTAGGTVRAEAARRRRGRWPRPGRAPTRAPRAP